MEKYSQYRDRGSGIAPFFPVPTQPAGAFLPFYLFLFAVRIPFLVTFTIAYFLIFQWLPIGSLGKKAALWLMIGTPGIWWIDLQIDGVKKGYRRTPPTPTQTKNRSPDKHSSLAKHTSTRLPGPGTIIAASHTSPLDALYLAAIFDPIFTASYPSTRLVQPISLLQAMLHALSPPALHPPLHSTAPLTDLGTLLAQHPDRAIVVFPECTTTNGRAILPFSPSLLTAPADAKLFPVSLRYTAPDITTPVPKAWVRFLWNLNSRPTHCIRVRIAECTYNTAAGAEKRRGQAQVEEELESVDTLVEGQDGEDGLGAEERKVLDRIGEALARLGRVKRVGLGVKEKIDFVRAWSRRRR
ncbi:MAG: hypothetical protein M1821_001725 [Bathelium mastoideum]|nr:MAG: hypothetical protein M1821_001725 [Bathelium mastoideum]KAI9691623.1 MAG: hypothetical protein M1822_007694 [Bathelium mastoideum]